MTPAETTSILTWWLAGGLFTAGLLLGAIIYAVINRKLQSKSDTRATLNEQQLNNYRTNVLKHLDEAGIIVQKLGDNYQSLTAKIRQSMHELGTTADGQPFLPPSFNDKTKQNTGHAHTDMPKTYVDPKHLPKD